MSQQPDKVSVECLREAVLPEQNGQHGLGEVGKWAKGSLPVSVLPVKPMIVELSLQSFLGGVCSCFLRLWSFLKDLSKNIIDVHVVIIIERGRVGGRGIILVVTEKRKKPLQLGNTIVIVLLVLKTNSLGWVVLI